MKIRVLIHQRPGDTNRLATNSKDNSRWGSRFRLFFISLCVRAQSLSALIQISLNLTKVFVQDISPSSNKVPASYVFTSFASRVGHAARDGPAQGRRLEGRAPVGFRWQHELPPRVISVPQSGPSANFASPSAPKCFRMCSWHEEEPGRPSPRRQTSAPSLLLRRFP